MFNSLLLWLHIINADRRKLAARADCIRILLLFIDNTRVLVPVQTHTALLKDVDLVIRHLFTGYSKVTKRTACPHIYRST